MKISEQVAQVLLIMVLLLSPGIGCSNNKTDSDTAKAAVAAPDANAQPTPVEGELPADASPPDHVNANQAMDYVKQIVGFGPRYLGSPGHQKTEDFLRSHLQGVELEVDSFTASTPSGSFPMRNYIAKFPGTKDGIVVISGHYDTLYTDKQFLGANDGGSSTGLPLALADVFRGKKKLDGYSVWIVWFDGEEAFQKWSATDGAYGSRHLAQKWKQDGTAGKLKGFLLLDMVGDKDLNINRDQNSTPWLLDLIYEAASRLGYQSHFFGRLNAVEDDHQAFGAVGIPVADLIDFDYGYNDVFWHSREDTVDKLSAQSLGIVGDVVLESVRLLNAKK